MYNNIYKGLIFNLGVYGRSFMTVNKDRESFNIDIRREMVILKFLKRSSHRRGSSFDCKPSEWVDLGG